MIESISINNFQSHKATRLKLAPTVNTLQGNSDCGKSAVMRAINWLLFNPAGDYFVSDWAKKGKTIVAPCEVTLEVNGHKITRRRDKEFNGYTMDGEVFEATRNSVPPQILEALGLGEVNVQRQLDPPFLLSMSAGDVSRYINSLVNLTRIDKWTVAVNGRARKLQQEAEAAEERESKARAEVESFAYLDRLELVSAEAAELESKVAAIEEEGNALENSLIKYDTECLVLGKLPDVDKVFILLAKASDEKTGAEKIGAAAEELAGQIKTHCEKLNVLAGLPNIEKAEAALACAREIAARKDTLENKMVMLSADINRRLGVRVPNVPNKFFEIVEMLGRWKNIQNNLIAASEDLKNDLMNHWKALEIVKSASAELEQVLIQLDGMVCPLCGRGGVHTHEEA